jgi:HdeA/HdeB family
VRDKAEHQSLAVQEGDMRENRIIGLVSVGLALGAVLAGSPATGKQVDQITCEEFLAMNPDDQQRIAYWVDGYQVAKGEAAVGTVAFDKFGQPIGALVEDCKATPKETLWEKLKKRL